jgi:hypothetical protein
MIRSTDWLLLLGWLPVNLGGPEDVAALSLIPLGFPDETAAAEDRYQSQRVHYDRWDTTRDDTPGPWQASPVGKRRV